MILATPTAIDLAPEAVWSVSVGWFVVEAQKTGNVVSSDRMEQLTARYLRHSL